MWGKDESELKSTWVWLSYLKKVERLFQQPLPPRTLTILFYPEKVHDEIAKVMGSTQPWMAHWTQMPYTDAVILEVQRFADILPTGLPRATTTNTIFKNNYIPKVRV